MADLIKLRAAPLVRALGLAELPVSEKQTRRIPMLGAVHLGGNGDGLSVTAASFDGTITVALEAEAEGEIAVPLDRLTDLARHFPADAELAIACRRQCGHGHAPADHGLSCRSFRFPTCRSGISLGEETGCVELDAKAARDLFARPAFAASTETSRFYLNGIFLHNVGDDLAAVATDGHRLCRITAPATTTLSTDRSLIIPNEMAKTVDRLIASASGNVTLRRSERLFSVEGTGFALVARMIDATYPNYERLISSEAPNVVTTSRARLRESLARFAAVADPLAKDASVKLRWNADGLHLSTPTAARIALPPMSRARPAPPSRSDISPTDRLPCAATASESVWTHPAA